MESGMRSANDSRGVQSAEITLQLLRLLIEAGGAMTLRSLSASARMSAAKAHRYLVSLIREGYVEQSGTDRHYDLGPRSLELAHACLARMEPVRVAGASLHELCRRVDETVALAVWGRGGPVFVRYEEPPHSMVGHVRVGAPIPVLRSASGRVLAAHLPAGIIRPFISGELKAAARARSSRGPRSWRAVARVLADVRSAGLSQVEGYLLNGINALSAPVFDHRGRAVLALTVLGDASRFDGSPRGAAARSLRATALDLSRRLGYSNGTVAKKAAAPSKASAGSGRDRKRAGTRVR
jgi:DNA-binding IclR family transcriptional regulator